MFFSSLVLSLMLGSAMAGLKEDVTQCLSVEPTGTKCCRVNGVLDTTCPDGSTFITDWDTSSVTDMSHMFSGSSFNQNLTWDTSNVINMNSMFSDTQMNSTLQFSDTSSVTDMSHMFRGSPFNQPLDFDTSSVTDMSYMFYGSQFNQVLCTQGWQHARSAVKTDWNLGANARFEDTCCGENQYGTVFGDCTDCPHIDGMPSVVGAESADECTKLSCEQIPDAADYINYQCCGC